MLLLSWFSLPIRSLSNLHRLLRCLSFLWCISERLAGISLLLLRCWQLLILNPLLDFLRIFNWSSGATSRFATELGNILGLATSILGWLRLLRSLTSVCRSRLLSGDFLHNRFVFGYFRFDKLGSWSRSLNIGSLGKKCLFDLLIHLSIKLLFQLLYLGSDNCIDMGTE